MPSPHKPDHERASRSLAALRPKLSRRPVSVSPVRGGDTNLRPATSSAAHQLRHMLGEHNPREKAKDYDARHLKPPRSMTLPSPEETVGVIQHQSAYIRQLESELRLCQGELSTYKVHLNDILEENARIVSAQQTSAIIKNVLDNSKPETPATQLSDKQALSKHRNDLELLKSLHASKAGILEQQLASTKDALHAAEQRAEEMRSRLLIQECQSAYDESGNRKSVGVCFKCGQREAVIAAHSNQSATVDQLQQEKDELIATLSNIKHQLADMQDREMLAAQKVKVGIEITEQANIDKTQALLEREQMSEELSCLRERLQAATAEHKRVLTEMKTSARQEVKNEITELDRRLKQANDAESQLKAMLEKLGREKDDAATELTKVKNELAIFHSSIVESTTGRRVDLTQLACERDMAVEDRNKLKNRIIKVEQIKDEAVLRVKQELENVRARLDKNERELVLSKEEAVKLTRANQDLDKQLHQSKMAYNSIDRSRNDELQSVTRRLEQREEELQRIIAETESRYSKQLNEMENMYVTQNRLVEQLRSECEAQAATIQNMSAKYRNENKQLKHDNQLYSKQLSKSRERLKVMDVHEVEHEKVHRKLRERVNSLDEENRALTHKANELTAKSSEYKREVDILAGEVNFLRCQVSGDPSANPHNRPNSSMVDEVLDALKEEMVSQDANITGSIDILRNVTKHSL
ncbi:serologically defined colon cancer antigen 8 homolog [Watersipora subatra]|uniref:serologically defined colon cancer antigen 8 homolog n=1 Tax=Watersipora subatra TaxID=2589382 RepID=UPI00355BE398